jgi:hypothetical protein
MQGQRFEYHPPEPFEQWVKWSLDHRLQMTAMFTQRLDRRRREYRGTGWVYMMRNPALRDPVVKIGLSRRYPTQRAAELTKSTGVFGAFELLYFIHVNDCYAAEAEVHRYLSDYRVTQGKEFFEVPLARAFDALDQVADKYPLLLPSKGILRALAQPFLRIRGECGSCRNGVTIRELLVPVKPRCRMCGTDVSLSVPIDV